MATKIKLLPCPFCGSKATMKMHKADPPEIDQAYCSIACSHADIRYYRKATGCLAGPLVVFDDPEIAARAWNTRGKSGDTAIQELRLAITEYARGKNNRIFSASTRRHS